MTRTYVGLLVVLGGLATAGCKNYDTPRTLRGSERPDRGDLPTDEQARRARARYPLIEDDFRIGPKTYNDRSSPTGVGY